MRKDKATITRLPLRRLLLLLPDGNGALVLAMGKSNIDRVLQSVGDSQDCPTLCNTNCGAQNVPK
jgi:hypothetical protein